MSGAPYGTVMEGNRLIEEKKHGQTLNISDSASEVKKIVLLSRRLISQ